MLLECSISDLDVVDQRQSSEASFRSQIPLMSPQHALAAIQTVAHNAALTPE